MTKSEATPTLVVKLKMATGTPSSGSTAPTLESKQSNRFPTLYDTVINVNVGPTQQRFVIHKNLLCHHSSYFKAALEGGFEESETGVIDLRDEDVEVFSIFNEWLYTGNVTYEHYEPNNGTWSALLNLYVFAEKRIVPKFQNALIDAMIKFAMKSLTYPGTEINLALANTATSSPLHGFLTELYARDVPLIEMFGEFGEGRQCFEVGFVMRVAIALEYMVEDAKGFKGGSNGLWKDRCLWHIHGPETPPCRDDSSLGGSE